MSDYGDDNPPPPPPSSGGGGGGGGGGERKGPPNIDGMHVSRLVGKAWEAVLSGCALQGAAAAAAGVDEGERHGLGYQGDGRWQVLCAAARVGTFTVWST